MIRIYERTALTQHTFSSVAIDGTGGGPLVITSGTEDKVHSGILRGIRVSCDSTDFNTSLRQYVHGKARTYNEVFSDTSACYKLSSESLYNGWINGDSPKTGQLYLVLVNNDRANGTGTITVQLTNLINKRFSRQSG